MRFFKLAGYVAIAGVLAACASQPEPMITPEPTFDKFGSGSCQEVCVCVPETAPQPPECIPEDDCDPITLADGSVEWDCQPPPPDRDWDDGYSSGRDPATGSQVAGTAGRT